MNTQLDISHPREYTPKLFVDREKQLELVEEVVRSAQSHENSTGQVINFWGGKGIGKTWILQHLEHKYSFESAQLRNFVLLCRFDRTSNTTLFDHITKSLIDAASIHARENLPALFNSFVEQAKLGKQDALVRALKSLSEKYVLILLLDDVDSVPQLEWDKFEQELLEPLITSGRVIITLTGRRQIARWRRFEVRRRVYNPEKSRVLPFSAKEVTNQLELLQKNKFINIPQSDIINKDDIVLWLHQCTGGNPSLIDYLVPLLMKWINGPSKSAAGKVRLRSVVEEHKKELIDVLTIAEEVQLESITALDDETHEELREALDSVGQLRYYRLEALKFMMICKARNIDKSNSEIYFLHLLRQLDQETDVVWWNRDRRAYATSEVARYILNYRLMLTDPDSYRRDHHAAIQMYTNWAQEYPHANEDYIIEIWFHLGSELLSLDETDIEVQKIKDEMFQTWQLGNKLNTDRLLVISQQLDDTNGDQELLSLLPWDIKDSLRRIIRERIEQKNSSILTRTSNPGAMPNLSADPAHRIVDIDSSHSDEVSLERVPHR